MTHDPPLNLFDYEALAEPKVHPVLWDFFVDGAGDRVTLAENRRAFDRIAVRPRVLVDVNRIDTATTVLGRPVRSPIMIAPCGPQSALCAEGELATVKAAGRAGLAMVASTGSGRTLEDIAAAATTPLWMQIYHYGDRPRTEVMVRRAEAAGYQAIALTVDSPRFGLKERSLRTEEQFDWPGSANEAGLPAWTIEPIRGAPVTWDDLDWLRTVTRLPIVLKGVLTAEDTALAAARGIEGIVVSNHGGRQMDGVVASIDALPEVVEAAGRQCEIYLDSGVRRGVDVLRALALGARAVLIGRPILWGLAVGGEDGAFAVLTMLKHELRAAMALAGRPTLASIDRTAVRAP